MKHRRYWLIVLSTSLAVTGLLAQRSSAKQENVGKGAKIFERSCSVCHSLRPNQAKNGPSLHAVLRIHSSAKSQERVRRIIAEGKDNMPGFKDRLSPEEISRLLDFLRNQH